MYNYHFLNNFIFLIIKHKMGNRQKIHLEGTQQYIVLHQKYDSYNLWINPQTTEQIQEHKIMFQSFDQIQFIRHIYQFRKMHHQFLVASFHFNKLEEAQLCSHSTQFSIFIERVPYNIQNLANINLSYSDTFYLYLQIFQGFQILFEKFGYFLIEPHMIFINKFGQIKIWCNSNKIICTPVSSITNEIAGQKRQIFMINRIIGIVDPIINNHSRLLLEIIRKNNPSTLKQAYHCIKQYAHSNRIKIEKFLTCLEGQKFHNTDNNQKYKPSVQYQKIQKTVDPHVFFRPMTTSVVFSHPPKQYEQIIKAGSNRPSLNISSQQIQRQKYQSNQINLFGLTKRVVSSYQENNYDVRKDKQKNKKILINNVNKYMNENESSESPINKFQEKIQRSNQWSKKHSIVDDINDYSPRKFPQKKLNIPTIKESIKQQDMNSNLKTKQYYRRNNNNNKNQIQLTKANEKSVPTLQTNVQNYQMNSYNTLPKTINYNVPQNQIFYLKK